MDEFQKKIKLVENKLPEVEAREQAIYEEYNEEYQPSEEIIKIQKKIAKTKAEQEKAAQPKQKQEFIVRLEGMAPVVAEFKVQAFDEEEAFQIVDKTPHLAYPAAPPRPDLGRLRKYKATVKNRLTGMINWMRHF